MILTYGRTTTRSKLWSVSLDQLDDATTRVVGGFALMSVLGKKNESHAFVRDQEYVTTRHWKGASSFSHMVRSSSATHEELCIESLTEEEPTEGFKSC